MNGHRRVASGLLLLAVFLAPLAASAARAQGAAIPEARTLVGVTARPVTVPAGGRADAEIRLTIARGWHVNANPPSLDYMIPTTLTVAGEGGVTPSAPVYPAPHRAKLSFEESVLLVYDGESVLRLPLGAAAGATPGTHRLKGQVGFQACNDQVCLAPVSVPFTLEVTVAGHAAVGATDTTDTTAATTPGIVTAPPAGGFVTSQPTGPATGSSFWVKKLEGALARGGLGWFLLLFGGGLLLNLTPCVFPMLGVTVSIFGARANEPLPKVLTHAAVYVLGLATMYSVLGVIAGLTGSLFGAALQNTWVNVALGLIMIALSLSMFGLYHMQPPLWLMSRVGGANTTSLAGLFASGLGVGVIAAPCIGPFVVAALAIIAARQDVWFGLQTMFTISLGLGLPYLVLGTFSNLLHKLPRSGYWMDWVKKVFGMILVGVGLYYLAMALAPRLVGWVFPVTLGVAGIVLGFLDRTPGGAGFRRMKLAVGSLAVLAAAGIVATTPKPGITFQAYDATAVAGDLPRGRPVLLDFSADWCIPCHKLETKTFSDRRVIAAMRGFDTYKVDLTRYSSPEVEAVRRQYGINGVPTLVFLDSSAREIQGTRVEGFMDPEPFLERVRIATAGGSVAAD